MSWNTCYELFNLLHIYIWWDGKNRALAPSAIAEMVPFRFQLTLNTLYGVLWFKRLHFTWPLAPDETRLYASRPVINSIISLKQSCVFWYAWLMLANNSYEAVFMLFMVFMSCFCFLFVFSFWYDSFYLLFSINWWKTCYLPSQKSMPSILSSDANLFGRPLKCLQLPRLSSNKSY